MLFTLVLVTGSLTDLEFTIEAKIDVSVFALSLQLPFFFSFLNVGSGGIKVMLAELAPYLLSHSLHSSRRYSRPCLWLTDFLK